MSEIIDVADVLNAAGENEKIVYMLDEDEFTINAYVFDNLGNLNNDEIKLISSSGVKSAAEKIGVITVYGGWLEQIEVKAAFQRRGIGCHLVELAVGYPLVLAFVAAVQVNTQYAHGLTPSGEYLIAACVREKFIHINHCSLSGEELEDLQQLKKYDDTNPILESVIVVAAIEAVKLATAALTTANVRLPSTAVKRTIGSSSAALPVSNASDNGLNIPLKRSHISSPDK